MATKQKHKLSRAARQEERAGLLFILAPIVGFLCFMLFPICFSIVLSFQSWTGIGDMRLWALITSQNSSQPRLSGTP